MTPRSSRGPSLTPLPAITVGPDPEAIAITPDRATAYVISYGDRHSGWVTPIRTASNTALRPIEVAGIPGDVLVAR